MIGPTLARGLSWAVRVSSSSPALGGLIAEALGLEKSFYFFALMFALGSIAGWRLMRLRTSQHALQESPP